MICQGSHSLRAMAAAQVGVSYDGLERCCRVSSDGRRRAHATIASAHAVRLIPRKAARVSKVA